MGITTEYKCDRCEHTQEERTQMWEVEVMRRSLDSPSASASAARQPPKKLWCKKCMEELHILPCKQGQEEKLPPPPTLEDLIREIIHEEGLRHG